MRTESDEAHVTLTDEDLLEALRQGDRAAFDALYESYERRLLGFILGYVRRREEAEEIFHDVFSQLLVEAKRAEPRPNSVSAWLFTVARNRCLNRRRGGQRATAAMPALVQHLAIVEPTEGELMAAERQQALRQAVAELPQRLSEVYHRRMAGQSYEDIAEQLAVPVGTVRSRINAMVQRLKKDLSLWTA